MKKVIKNYLAKLQENDKKGFSLVELIIVMAIMAILVGIVASQVLPYMEKSRQSKDQQVLSSILTDLVSATAQSGSTLTSRTAKITDVTSGTGDSSWKNVGKILSELRNGDITQNELDGELASKAASQSGNEVDFEYNADTGKITVFIKGKTKGDKLYVESQN
jgi:type IV pilus assembly protein PilA